MAASPIYQRAKLVQFGFTNSHPDFTKGGDLHVVQLHQPGGGAAEAVRLRRPARLQAPGGAAPQHRLGPHREGRVREGGAGRLGRRWRRSRPTFRPSRISARPWCASRDSNPDGLVLLSYYADGALICRQARDTGIELPIVAGTSNYSPKFLELGGAGVEGVYVMTHLLPRRPAAGGAGLRQGVPGEIRCRARQLQRRRLRHDGAVGRSWCEGWGATREAMQTGLPRSSDVPSVIYGTITFDPADPPRAGGVATSVWWSATASSPCGTAPGPRRARHRPAMSSWLDYTINGLIVGNIYALLAVGLALIFGVSHLINFAQGSIYAVGAFIGWTCATYLHTPLPVTMLIVVAGVPAAGRADRAARVAAAGRVAADRAAAGHDRHLLRAGPGLQLDLLARPARAAQPAAELAHPGRRRDDRRARPADRGHGHRQRGRAVRLPALLQASAGRCGPPRRTARPRARWASTRTR